MPDENIDPRLMNVDAGQDIARQTNDNGLPPPPQGSELHARSNNGRGQSLGNIVQHIWVPISSHTAKCDLCLEHNTSVCQRCLGCNRQLCRNCIQSALYDGVHSFSMADLDWTPAPPVRRGPRAPPALPAGLGLASGAANTSSVVASQSAAGPIQSSSSANPSLSGASYSTLGASSLGSSYVGSSSAGSTTTSQFTTGFSSISPSSSGHSSIAAPNSHSASEDSSSFIPINSSLTANINSSTTGSGVRFTARRTRSSSRRNASSSQANTSTHMNASSSRTTSSSTRARSGTKTGSGVQNDSGAQRDSGTKARTGRFGTIGSGTKRWRLESDDEDDKSFNHDNENFNAARRRPSSGRKLPGTSRPRSGVKRKYLYASDDDEEVYDSDDDYEEVIPAKKSKTTKGNSSRTSLACSTAAGNSYFAKPDPAKASESGKHTIKIKTEKIKKATNSISISSSGWGSGSSAAAVENERPSGVLDGNAMYTPGYEPGLSMSGELSGSLYGNVTYTPGYETRANMSGKKYQETMSASVATTKTRTVRSGRKLRVQASTTVTTSTQTYDAPSTSQPKNEPTSDTEQVTEAKLRDEKEAEERVTKERDAAWKHNEAIRDLKNKGKFREAKQLIEHAETLLKMGR